jgi:DNA-binding CsgD family transcriptional regulator
VALDVARAVAAPRELVRALTVLGQVYTHLGETNRAEAVLAEAGRLLHVVLDPDIRALSYRWRGWTGFIHGDFEGSLAHDRHGFEIARRQGADGRYGAHLLDSILENLVELGRWPEAFATADQIMTRVAFSFEMVYSHMSLARLNTYLGRTEDAEREIEQGVRIPTVGPHRVWQLEDQIFLAYATGRYADGRRLMDASIEALPEPEHDATLWWSLVKATEGEADHAGSARRRRRRKEADEAVVAGRRYIDLFRRSALRAIDADGGGPLVRAEVMRMDAEAERLEGLADPARWAAAVQARSELQQPWELASVRYRHAEAILGSGGSVADAAIPLREAYAVAIALGALPLQRAIQALASRARIRLDSAADAATADTSRDPLLTTREREVLALVAVGHTNREIGDRLFISEKTASVHVTHAMDKLGALSRYDAAAAATRLGLLPPADG